MEFRLSVIPAKAGIQGRGDVNLVRALDPRIRGEDSVAVTFNFDSERCRPGIKPTAPKAGIQWRGDVNLAKSLDSRMRGNDSVLL